MASASSRSRSSCIDGVEETLALLAERHDLTLMTKGHPEEQQLKIDRSGLGDYFRHAEVVPEKDPAAYRRSWRGWSSTRRAPG